MRTACAAYDSAEQARVADYASPELGEARNKLSAAKTAVQLEEMTTARRLADTALAKSRSGNPLFVIRNPGRVTLARATFEADAIDNADVAAAVMD